MKYYFIGIAIILVGVLIYLITPSTLKLSDLTVIDVIDDSCLKYENYQIFYNKREYSEKLESYYPQAICNEKTYMSLLKNTLNFDSSKYGIIVSLGRRIKSINYYKKYGIKKYPVKADIKIDSKRENRIFIYRIPKKPILSIFEDG